MRKKIQYITITLLICTLINCLFVVNFAFAEDNALWGEMILESFETFIDLRDEFIDIVAYFNPMRSDRMLRNNDFMEDLLEVVKDLYENRQRYQSTWSSLRGALK